MHCKNELASSSADNWEALSSLELQQELLASTLGPTENLAVGNHDLSLQGALWRVFESEGKKVVITFDKESRSHGPEYTAVAASTTVVASVLLPFGWEELVSRVSSMRSHTRTTNDRHLYLFGDVRVDFLSMEVVRSSGMSVDLTAQEFKMLKFFLMNPDRVISRDELLSQAWGYDNYPCTRTVDNHILRLRQKLESDPSNPIHFRTVPRVGYKFVFSS
jgi:DNA-binding winged helix-turn-helix (wHTH) protein